MTRNISPALAQHFAGDTLTLATCWKLTRRDGVVMGFTDHVDTITHEGVTYIASVGFEPTDMQQRADMSVDNMEVAGILDNAAITEVDIQAGLYDYAQIDIFMVNYEDLTQGHMLISRGWIGEVTLKRGQFVAEVRGLSQRLSSHVGRIYGPSCDATLGDARCGVDVSAAPFTSTLVRVTSVQDNAQFSTDGVITSATFFNGGLLHWQEGHNAGRRMEVKTYGVDGVMTLVLPMPQEVRIGDAFTVSAGCDKSRATCQSRFHNLLNFRGFPDLPGQDRLLQTAGTLP